MIPQFADKTQLLEWLKLNKDLLISQKKSAIKYADAVGYSYLPASDGDGTEKELSVNTGDSPTTIYAKVVMNTTNIMDSHKDVHIPGLWKKTLAENKSLYHLQEHKMSFDKVISDEVNPTTKSISWKSLGFNYEGNTQALIFESTIKESRNPFMFDQYRKGYVKNHSVGMQYVKILMAVDSTDKYWAEEKAVWDEYIGQVVNAQAAKDQGFFFAVKEAKLIEGSAVLVGSNQATPTILITDQTEAGKSTSESIEPSADTHSTPSYTPMAKRINNIHQQTKKK